MPERKLVLVVDDHVDERVITRIFLEHFGYDVSTAGSGEEAVATARRQKPDLIMMDLMMPRLDGVDVMDRLRADPDTAAIPIIAYTAYRDVYGDRLAQAGPCATLEKPADSATLRAAVVEQIGDPHVGREKGRA